MHSTLLCLNSRGGMWCPVSHSSAIIDSNSTEYNIRGSTRTRVQFSSMVIQYGIHVLSTNAVLEYSSTQVSTVRPVHCTAASHHAPTAALLLGLGNELSGKSPISD